MANKKGTLKGKKIVQGVKASKPNPNIPLDQLMGESVNNPFPTSDEAEFQKLLDGMDLLDMEELGTKVYLRPVHDRRIMKSRLMKEFKVIMAKMSHAGIFSHLEDRNKPLPKKRARIAEQIMKEGR